MNKGFDQVAAFQKLWTDSFANMTGVWSQFFPRLPALTAGRNYESAWPKPGMNTCGRPKNDEGIAERR